MTSSSTPRGFGTVTTATSTRIVSQQVSSRDITAEFTDAASKLATGQLVKDEYFTLFEAVGALEIGDAKMDSGYLEPGETMEDEYDIRRDLSAAEVMGVMEQLVSQEVAWQSGHPLSQTLFTSIYIDRLLWPEPKSLGQAHFIRPVVDSQPLVHRVLRAYCLGLVKTCDLIHTKITSEHFYEEEDFSSQLYNRPLLHKFDVKEIQWLLDDALQWIEQSEIDSKLKGAITKHLVFRKTFLTALEADTRGPNNRKPIDYRTCISLLNEIEETKSLAIAVPDSFSLKIQRRLASSVPPRPMVSISSTEAFKRLKQFCNDAADIDQLVSTTSNGSFLTALVVFMSRNPQPSVYIRSLAQSLIYHRETAFGNKSMREFVYSDLEALVLPDSAMLLLEPSDEIIDEEDPRAQLDQLAILLNDFVHRAGLTYVNMFRTICLNRSRFRRTLCHAVLDFDSIQADAEDIDTTLRDYTREDSLVYSTSPVPTFAYPLSSWMYHYKLYQLEHIIQVGFELSIYAVDEFPQMYWYLSHICTTHLSHLDRICFFVEQEGQARKSLPKSETSNPEHRAKVDKTMKNLDRVFIRARATDALARALHLLYNVLNRHKLVPKPSRPYSTDKLRYELRMRPFLPLSIPEPVTFEDYQREGSLSHIGDIDLLEAAKQSVADARKGWEEVMAAKWMDETIDSTDSVKAGGTSLEKEWTQDVKNTIRACIATSIAIAAVKAKLEGLAEKSSGKKESGKTSTTPTLDLKVEIPLAGEKGCWHDWWLVPKISS